MHSHCTDRVVNFNEVNKWDASCSDKTAHRSDYDGLKRLDQ